MSIAYPTQGVLRKPPSRQLSIAQERIANEQLLLIKLENEQRFRDIFNKIAQAAEQLDSVPNLSSEKRLEGERLSGLVLKAAQEKDTPTLDNLYAEYQHLIKTATPQEAAVATAILNDRRSAFQKLKQFFMGTPTANGTT